MKWGLWSTTAASNSATPPDGWPEGQLPSTVNDCAREMMAQIRTGLNDLQFIDLGVVPTETSNVTFTLPGNQMQWYPYGNRVKANVGGTQYYGTVISSSFTVNTGVTLRFDPGANQTPLTTSLSAVATGYPSTVNGAIPEIVYRARNWFINPQFDIWQRGPGPASLSSNTQIRQADCWLVYNAVVSAGCTLAISRAERSANASNVPTLAQAGAFITNSLRISCNVAVTGLAAADFGYLSQRIEGYQYRQFAGKPITVSFWVNSTITGTYCVNITNSNADRSIVLQYSISSVSTWEQKTLTFPKPPVAGTWDYSTGIGLAVNFCIGSGATLQGGAGNWTAANILCTAAQTNFLGVANSTIMFSDMRLVEGNSYIPTIPYDYAQTLENCQRFLPAFHAFGSSDIVGIGQAANASNAYVLMPFIVTPRIPPTGIVITSALFYLTGANAASATGSSVSTIIFSGSSYNGILLQATVAAGGLVAGNATLLISEISSGSILCTGAEL